LAVIEAGPDAEAAEEITRFAETFISKAQRKAA
jgi:hypothetical protein